MKQEGKLFDFEEHIMPGQRVMLDDLPKYVPWLRAYLGGETLDTFKKNSANIRREYEVEKWSRLLMELRRRDVSRVSAAEHLFCGDQDKVISSRDMFWRTTAIRARQSFLMYVKQALKETSGAHFVELGAGFGSVILNVAEACEFQAATFTACELTESGIACIRLLSHHLEQRVVSGPCDLEKLSLDEYDIPERAVVLTSWAMGYMNGFPEPTMYELLKLRPMRVIHFEPVYEHFESNTMLGLCRRKYHEVNDYNMHMMSSLRSYEARGLIKIVREERNVLGENVLSPVSRIEWVPA